jgi:hypothetical protein|tara:strand:- start:1586 stop:1795 length:210 start_codon:yes stop_codon:yes gene_type:complete
MSKTGAWYLEMQEDAAEMSREHFVEKHGAHNVDLWEEVHEELGDVDEMQSRLDQVISRMNKAFTKKITQ